jgi:ribonucleoside-diphosphate reductase alpha chain
MPFTPKAEFDFAGFGRAWNCRPACSTTCSTPPTGRSSSSMKEANAKRRIGLGFTGLGDALIMLGLRYDTPRPAPWPPSISAFMRDRAYLASVELAKERGAFPLFNADLYLSGGNFASRLPAEIKEQIRKHGIRNSHLLSIAPDRHHLAGLRRQRLQRHRAALLVDLHAQEAHGRRHLQGIRGRGLRVAPVQVPRRRHERSCRPTSSPRWKSRAQAHKDMVAAVAPYIDTSISKTVNVPEDYPYADFEDLYLTAWKAGLKGLATYRPNSVLGAVLSVEPKASAEKKQPQDVRIDDANPASRSRACRRRCSPACAGPAARACPTATRHGPT